MMNTACRNTRQRRLGPAGGGGMNTVSEIGQRGGDEDDGEERIDAAAWQARPKPHGRGLPVRARDVSVS